MEYMIVKETDFYEDSALCKLEQHVGQAIKDGWKPKGGVEISNLDRGFIFAQAMVKKEEKMYAEHSKKTRMKDFFEKHPKAPRNQYGRPSACARIVGYCDICQRNKFGNVDCELCWNEPLEE